MEFKNKLNKLNAEMAMASLDEAEARELEARAEKLMGFYQEKVDKALAATRKPARRRWTGGTVVFKYRGYKGVVGGRRSAVDEAVERALKMVKKGKKLKGLGTGTLVEVKAAKKLKDLKAAKKAVKGLKKG